MTPRKINTMSSSTLDGEIILLNSETGRFYSLGGAAKFVWNAIDGIRTFRCIQTLTAERYHVDSAICFSEVTAFVDQLYREGIIEMSALPTGTS